MANIVVASTTNSIKVDFGTYSSDPLIGYEAATYQKKDVRFYKFSDYVRGVVSGERDWSLSYNGTSGTFTIDTIDGIAPSSNSDLYTKLIAIIA